MKCTRIISTSTAIFLFLLFKGIGHAVPIHNSAEVYISNIDISNIKDLQITSKVVDYNFNNTSARAYASDNYDGGFFTHAQLTYRGEVSDFSDSGNAFALAALNYNTTPDSIFMGSTYALYSSVMLNDYGYSWSVSSIAEFIRFTALSSVDITFSFEFSGMDGGLNPGLGVDHSTAGISYDITNFSDGISEGLAASISQAEAYAISPGKLSTTLHFDQGEIGQFGLVLAASNRIYRENQNPAPVPEPASMILLGAGLASFAGSRLLKKKKQRFL
jgi:hypothetical protein